MGLAPAWMAPRQLTTDRRKIRIWGTEARRETMAGHLPGTAKDDRDFWGAPCPGIYPALEQASGVNPENPRGIEVQGCLHDQAISKHNETWHWPQKFSHST